MAYRSSENVAQFKYLWKAVIGRNVMNEDIKNRLNLANASYHSVPNLESTRLLPKNFKIKTYKTTISPVGFAWIGLILWEEHRLRVVRNRVGEYLGKVVL
jgi:hypothetical protein